MPRSMSKPEVGSGTGAAAAVYQPPAEKDVEVDNAAWD